MQCQHLSLHSLSLIPSSQSAPLSLMTALGRARTDGSVRSPVSTGAGEYLLHRFQFGGARLGRCYGGPIAVVVERLVLRKVQSMYTSGRRRHPKPICQGRISGIGHGGCFLPRKCQSVPTLFTQRENMAGEGTNPERLGAESSTTQYVRSRYLSFSCGCPVPAIPSC